MLIYRKYMVIKAFAGIIDQDPTLTRKTRDYFGFTIYPKELDWTEQ